MTYEKPINKFNAFDWHRWLTKNKKMYSMMKEKVSRKTKQKQNKKFKCGQRANIGDLRLIIKLARDS